MADRTPTLWTIGYEILQPSPLVAELQAAGVQRLLDVRYRPQSRRPGMSKTRLGDWLREHGIVYEHRRALGTPPDLRVLYRAGREVEAAPQFRAHVEATAVDELDALAGELARPGTQQTVLMCLESDPATCHRRVLAEALAARVERLRVIDL